MVDQKITYVFLSSLKSKQKGVVFVVALVFLIALTAVAAALMQNSTTDMKMSGASEEKSKATQEAISAVDEIVFQQITTGTGNNDFALPPVRFAKPLDVMGDLKIINKSGKMSVAQIDMPQNQFKLESDCPHTKQASSSGLFTCNVLRVQVQRKYGRHDNNTIVVNSAVAQQLLR